MPWTDVDPEVGHSRDQVLADVVRRGGRLRRRRRTAAALAAAVAVLIPVVAFVAAGGMTVDRPVRLTVAGPGPARQAVPFVPTSVVDGPSGVDPMPAVSVAPSVPASTVPSTPLLGGATNPEPSTVVAPRVDVDDPIVRPPRPVPTTAALAVGANSGAASSPALTTPIGLDGGSPPTTVPPCPLSQVKVTVATDKASYAPGETVRWTSTLTNASGTTCAVSGRAFFHVEDASGATVGSFPHTADYMLPVKAEPGRAFTSSFSWDQTNCANGPCIRVPAGTYTVVAEWTEAGPYVGKGSFGITG